MKQFTKQLRWLLASLMLVAGLSSAWADDPFYTLDTTGSLRGTNNNYASNCNITSGGITWNFTGNTQQNPWRLGGKSISNTDRTVKTNTAMGSAISKVELEVGAASNITVNSLTLTVASDASFSNVIENVTGTFAANSTITFEPTSASWDKDAYYKFTFNVTVSASSNRFVEFKGVKFYEAEDTGDTRTETTVEFPASAYSFNLGETFTSPVATLTPAAAGSVTYASSKESVATVDASTGALTLVAAGTTTITATFAETTQYKGSHAQYTLTVVDPNANDGSEEHPYTVAEARAAIDAGTGITGVYVKGIVSKIVTAYNSQYGNISYNISDDGTEEADQLQAFRGVSYEGASFTSEDDIQVTDEVVVKGNLTLYGSTYELAQGNVLVSNSRTAPDTRTETHITFYQGANDFLTGKALTLTEGDSFENVTAYVTIASGAMPTDATGAITYEGDNNALGTVHATTGSITWEDGATGTLTVTATFAGDDTYKPCEGYYTVTVNPAEVTPTGEGDVITAEFIDISGNSYSNWSGKTGKSGAVYAGNTFGGSTSVQMRSSNSNSGIITTKSPGKATMVSVEWDSNTANGRTLDIYGSNTAYESAADLYNSSKQGTKLGSIVYGTSTQLAIEGDYAYIGIRSNNGALYCNKITIYWETTTDTRTATTVTLNPSDASYEVTLGDDFTAPTATLDPEAAGTLTYESSNEDVATVASNGAVTILAAGTTTITAKFAGSDDYKPSEASYTITVTDPNAKGTETNPYTVAEAIAYIETLGASTSPSEVYVSGIISQVDGYNSTYKSITYWISDDGETTTQMEVYSGKGLEGADFSAAEDLQKGDIVTIFGFVKKYSGTPEFDKNNKLVSFERPTVAVEAPVFSVDGGTYTEDQTVEITCATTGASIYYTLDGTEPTTASTPYTAALTISETTTLKAIASDGTNVSTVTTATYTINKPDVPNAKAYGTEYYTKVTDLSQIEDGDAVIIVNEAYNSALSTTQNTNNRSKVAFEWMPWIGGSFVQLEGNSTVEKFIIDKDGENFYFYFYASRGTKDGYIYAASSSNNQLKTTDTKSNNAKAVITIENGDATITFQGTNTRNLLRYNASDGLFACYGSGQQPVQLYVERPASEVEAEQTVTVADAQDCYKTFITPYDARFDGVNDHAYIVTLRADQKEANLNEVHCVPAGTPIIYKYKTAGKHPITRAISGSDVLEDVSDNVLKVSRGEVEGDGTVFVLNKVNDVVGFYRLNDSMPLATGKCYLKIEKSTDVKFIGFNVDDVATGIETVESTMDKVQGTIYDLQGRRVTTPAHGLYIVNGKKVFIK